MVVTKSWFSFETRWTVHIRLAAARGHIAHPLQTTPARCDLWPRSPTSPNLNAKASLTFCEPTGAQDLGGLKSLPGTELLGVPQATCTDADGAAQCVEE